MASLSEILSRHNFRQITPTNADQFVFSGPGICILMLGTDADEPPYRPIAAYSSEDALEVAKRLLRQRPAENEEGDRVVFLAPVFPERGARLSVLEEISEHCMIGTEGDV